MPTTATTRASTRISSHRPAADPAIPDPAAPSPHGRGRRRAGGAVAVLVAGAILSGCSAAPRSSGEPAGATCTPDGRDCDVRLVRGGEPTILRKGHRGGAFDMFIVQISPGSQRTIQFGDSRNIKGGSKYKKHPQFYPGYNFSAAYDGTQKDLKVFGARVDFLEMNIDDAHLRIRFPKNWRASR